MNGKQYFLLCGAPECRLYVAHFRAVSVYAYNVLEIKYPTAGSKTVPTYTVFHSNKRTAYELKLHLLPS
jgi:hypothetical protein